MKYYLLTLKFLTPVHFGDAANGGGLEKVTFTCSADTFFSALCNEAAAQSPAFAERLIEMFAEGKMQISSLMPYCKTAEDGMQFYLPKPLLPIERPIAEAKSFAEMKQAATALKKVKKSLYIRASQMRRFLASSPFDDSAPVFAVPVLSTKVNTRKEEPLPYYVASYCFKENTGLYLICGAEDTQAFCKLKDLIESLGLSGIGGKRSSGYGKFQLVDDEIELDINAGCYEDDEALAAMLMEEAASWQMCIAPLHPEREYVSIVKEGAYKLVKRSGFVASPAANTGVKRASVYMLAEGSCLPIRIQGCLVKQAVPGLEHNIYRNGLGMFVGLRNEQ